MGEMNQKFKPGAEITLTAGATITGGQLVMVSTSADNTVIPTSGVVTTWLGVAKQDAASGEKVVVTRGGVQVLGSTGAIVRGARVVAAAAGVVQTIASNDEDAAVGTALASAASNKVLVAMDR